MKFAAGTIHMFSLVYVYRLISLVFLFFFKERLNIKDNSASKCDKARLRTQFVHHLKHLFMIKTKT